MEDVSFLSLAPLFGCLTKIEHEERAQELKQVKAELEDIKKKLIIHKIGDMWYLWNRGSNKGETFEETKTRCNLVLKEIGLPIMQFEVWSEKTYWVQSLAKFETAKIIEFHKFLHQENHLYHVGCYRETPEHERTFQDWMTIYGISLI